MFFLTFGAFVFFNTNVFAAEAGMPQLNPEYWASQGFWLILIFTLLYLTISKLFIPKIKDGIDKRDNKIKDDLDEAKSLKDVAEKKLEEYNIAILRAKKEVQKILAENKNKLNLDIQNKKKAIEKEIEAEVNKAQKEIMSLKKNSINDVAEISEEITSKIIEEISGDKLNQSSVKAIISDSLKKNMEKYL
tara:strand:+ start:261 stop:830 length:570 start_codon:yes stop_codon:yes gene_type:complete